MHPILTGNLVLVNKTNAATDTIKLQFKYDNLTTLTGEPFDKTLNFKPGQFMSLGFTETAWRAYSIASIPSEEVLELMVRLVEGGVGSEALAAANLGDKIPFKGPFGHFGLSSHPDAHLVFCATGTGIAPFRSMIKAEQSRQNPRPMTLLYGGKNADDLAYLDEVNQWADNLSVKLGLSRDPDVKIPAGLEGEAHKCRITQLLEDLEVSDTHEFYLCGNGAMVKSVQELLAAKAIDKDRIFMERFN